MLYIYIFFNGSGLVKADVSFYVCFCFKLTSLLNFFGLTLIWIVAKKKHGHSKTCFELPGLQGRGPGLLCRQNTMTRSIPCCLVVDLPSWKNDGVRQWEGWHLYEMENKTCSKPPISLKKVAAFGCVSKFLPLHAITGYSPRGSLSWWICLGKKDPILGTPQYPRHSKGAIGAIPINGWFRMDKSPTKMDDLGVPRLQETTWRVPHLIPSHHCPISSCFRHEKFTSDPVRCLTLVRDGGWGWGLAGGWGVG